MPLQRLHRSNELEDVAAAASQAPTDRCEDEAEEEGVVIEAVVRGFLSDAIEQYAKYMEEGFGHVKSLDPKVKEGLVRTVRDAPVAEINTKWCFSFSDPSQWVGYDDGLKRPIMPSKCSGDAYKSIKREIAKQENLSDDQRDDLIFYIFATAITIIDDDPTIVRDYDIFKIFQMETQKTTPRAFKLSIDSWTIDPNIRTGDEILLDLEKIQDVRKLVCEIFGSWKVSVALIGYNESEDEEEDGSESDSDSDCFVVPDGEVSESSESEEEDD
jgi:hypothetical protein